MIVSSLATIVSHECCDNPHHAHDEQHACHVEQRACGVRIEGVALRDRPADIAKFLSDNGDPYRAIGNDPDSRLQLLLGSSGVPESFVIDGKGVIRYQHIGDIRPEHVPVLLAEGVAQLAGENRRGAGAELRIPALVGRPCLLGSP